MIKKTFFFVFIFFIFQNNLNADSYKSSMSGEYIRLSDVIIKDLDKDDIDEIAVSSFSFNGKFIDIYKVINGNLKLIDSEVVPERAIFFDVGDVDNDGIADIVVLTSEGFYYRNIKTDIKSIEKFKVIKHIFSEIVIAQPELLKAVSMVIDLDGNGKNDLVIENIRAIEIYETNDFTKVASISLTTMLEFSMVPGQFYPYYIFYTLPFIQITDLDNDGKMEIITKFPYAISIYAQKTLNNWYSKKGIVIPSDNVYFLSNSFVKFSFPVISDIDSDNNKEIVVSSANLDMPKIRFEAIGSPYFYQNSGYTLNKKKQLVIKGIPLNLPFFINVSDPKYKDFILPVVPFNLITIFSLLSGNGDVTIPFMYYKQDKDKFDISHGKKLFDINFRIENITSFIEELPFDYYSKGQFPDFYYFLHNMKDKSVNILYYHYDPAKNNFRQDIIANLSIPAYTAELPAVLKLGHFSKNIKKDALYMFHQKFFIITRQ